MKSGDNIDLAETVSEVESHLENSSERILAYYESEMDSPRDDAESEVRQLSDDVQSPAELLVEDAANIINYEITLREIETEVGWSDFGASNRVHYILFGVGAELLIHSYCLRDDPLEFVERLKENNAPSIENGRQKLCSELVPHLSNTQMRRLNLVLRLLYLQRNNSVHTGFHQQFHYANVPPVYEVLGFLFEYVSETTPDVVSTLNEEATRLRDNELNSIEPVEFPDVQDVEGTD